MGLNDNMRLRHRNSHEMPSKVRKKDQVVFNYFPNKPWLRYISFENTVGKKEKLLVTSNFYFLKAFSTHLEDFPPFSSNLNLLCASSFCFKESEIWHLGKV